MKARKLRKRFPHLFQSKVEKSYSGEDYTDKCWHNSSKEWREYHRDKCKSVILYILKQGGPMPKDKLLNLMYLATRAHLRTYGRMLWEDTWFAKPEGPRPFYAELLIDDMLEEKSIALVEETNNKV